MHIVSDPLELRRLASEWRCERRSIGFVPTMGALHQGHAELVRRARAANDRVVASIFLNPTQFGPSEDLERYPRPVERDRALLAEMGVDALFCPSSEAMWGGADFLHGTWVDVSPFDEMWEGVTRPGHLRGVATVVAKLFNITSATHAYFGEKDFQQLRVVQALARDLNFDIEIVPVPTVREADGLALSSRNALLAPEDRAAAAALHQAMCAARERREAGERDVAILGRVMEEVLERHPRLETQYIAIVDPQTLTSRTCLDQAPARVLIAAFLGEVRLIDNMEI